MKKIHCNQCNKFLFETEKSWGAAGAEAQHKGFVYKIPALFTDKYPRLFFCNHECGKLFYNEKIPKNEEVTKQINELKAEIPDHAKACAKALGQIHSMMGLPKSAFGKQGPHKK
ncbi:hypothetical protein [Draconibacterium mangrovi]|uniref:hypothetical protein n=1 Tax=Draconibacterium mangrovi TaxID=2697469 RepID=UPI0013D1A46D|nr:hypothetical protein [Draconibacterium mangrovi]